ncbi:MAG: helix-turn-helix transcriptional regulator [Chloroflexi bacterium]|nr:helix-turn-helix transcriptional regulator [Chloroflexota bacterium]
MPTVLAHDSPSPATAADGAPAIDLGKNRAGDEPGRHSFEPLFSSISCSVLSATCRHFPPAWQVPPRQASHYSLYLCLDGGADFVVGGQAYTLEAGGMLLIPPRVPQHAAHDPHRPLYAYAIDFTARLHGLLDVPAVCGLPVALRPSAVRWPKLLESAHAVVLHLTKRMPGYELAVHTHCVRLLDLLWKDTIAQTGRSASLGDVRAAEVARLLAVFRVIEERYAEHLTLAQLAGLVHLHPAYFSTVFKKVTGLPPLHYLAQYRLQRARDLLLATDRSVADIATLTGFYDAAHLIHAFRRSLGVSPGRYRRSKRNPIFQ